jgi:predicted esterase
MTMQPFRAVLVFLRSARRQAGRFALLAVALAPLSHARSAELEQREPDAKAPAHKDFGWRSKGGLAYAWRLPRDYSADKPVHLTLICHGTGLDHRWGPANHPAASFRPLDIVVSLDGPSPAEKSRLFLDERDDVEAVAEFLAEMRERFAIQSVFLYGHSQGGFFVSFYAGERPKDVAGVVAHASGMWAQAKTAKSLHGIAYSFLHGTHDPVVPYRQSVGARDALVELGFPLVRLRRLETYNHWPNAVRSTEELDWCQGMTSASPEEALACAERILAPKPADEYQWTTAVGFSGARAVLQRLVGQGTAAFETVDAKVRARAAKLLEALEAHAGEHVAELRRALGKNKALALDGGAWLGHLASVREDLRGCDAVETFATELGYDKLLAKHAAAARKVFDAWYGDDPPAAKYEELVEAVGACYLFEGLPAELGEQMSEWRKQEKGFGTSKKTSKAYEAVERWNSGWSEGFKAYGQLWKKWKAPAR